MEGELYFFLDLILRNVAKMLSDVMKYYLGAKHLLLVDVVF